jgi:glycosyltransferase involved in cell wall biosynthesis
VTEAALDTRARRDAERLADEHAPPPRGAGRSGALAAIEPVCVINGRFTTQPATGVQRYAREVTRALDAILAGANQRARLLAPMPPREPLDLRAIDITILPPTTGHVWEQTRLVGLGRRPLLNLCNTAPALGGGNIVCIHDANVFIAPDSYSRAFRVVYKTLQPWIARRAMAVATVSRDAAARIASHLGLPLARVAVLPNGHEHALRWNPDLSRFKGACRRPYVLMIGSLARHKNIARIVGLAEALDALGLDIKIAGGTAAVFAAAFHAASPNLEWLGRVSDDDLACLLRDATCLAFPSTSEGFGIPALEAMTLGCPVVASDTTSLPEVCGDAALYASPGDDAQWMARFTALARSPDLRDTMREKGLARAMTFSWRDTAAGYHDLVASA